MDSPTLIQITPRGFMALLYADANPQGGFMEFRLLPSRKQIWMPFPLWEGHPDEITLEKLDTKQNLYFGISIRSSAGQGGRDGCHPTHLLWADLDLKNSQWCESKNPELLPAETIREACVVRFEALMGECAVLGLRPRAVTYSGHGLQVYFACSVQLSPTETEAMNKALARMLEGDSKVYDVARIFRVPGSQNLKNPERPLTVELWYSDEEAVNSALDLPRILEPLL